MEAPAQFWIHALVGRFNKSNTHWSPTNVPDEIVFFDPLPAACGGAEYDPTEPLTINACVQSWDTKWVTPVSPDEIPFSSFTMDDSSGTYYRPGYFYRYYTGVEDPVRGLEKDQYGGHTNGSGFWHMHNNDLFLSGYENCVIGYALDGTPIMGGSSTVYDKDYNRLGVAESSWVRREDDEYASISNYAKNGEGYYHFDYKYDSNSNGNLDKFNGGYTEIDGELTYAYFITESYPNGTRNLKGKVENVKS